MYRFRRDMLLWCAPLFMGLTGPVIAADQTYQFDIPAEPLGQALTDFSKASSQQIVFSEAVINGKSTAGLHGRYTTSAALSALLAGTGLTAETNAAGVTMIRPRKVPSSLNEAQTDQGASVQTTSAEKADGQRPSQNEDIRLEEVVVTAQKKEERLQDVPVPVSVLSGDSLASQNQLLLSDYATSVPGFVVAPVGVGEQQLAIRGITTSNFTLPTVGVTIDGVPYGGLIDVPDIDPGDLARVEVLRGPQGTLYGSASMGGLVNFVTKEPSLTGYSGSLQAGTSTVYNGSGAGYSLRGSANLPLNNVTALRISGYSYTNPGYIDNPVLNLQGVNRTDAYGGRAALLFQPLDNLSIKFSTLYDHIDQRGSSEVGVPTVGYPRTTGLGDLQQNYMPGLGGQRKETQAYSLTLNADLGPVKLVSLSGYNNVYDPSSFDWTEVYGSEAQRDFGVEGAGTYAFTHYKKYTEELRLSGSLGDRFDWLVGGFYSHTKLYGDELVTANDPATGRIVGNVWILIYPRTYQETAGFVNLTYHFTDRFDVQFGGRESNNQEHQAPETQEGPLTRSTTPVVSPAESSNENAFTYLVTPRWKLSQDFMVYARFASGFRPGGPNQHPVGIPPAYSPDKTQNYELGAKGDLLEHLLSIDTAVYYINWKNIQLEKVAPDTGLAYTANGGGAKSEGVEVSVTLRPTKGLSISGWYAYNNAVLTEAFPANSTFYGLPGDRLPLSSRNSGYLNVEDDFVLTGSTSAFVAATERFIGDRVGVFTGNAQRQDLPAYQLTDLRAGVKQDSWTTTLYVNNLFDRRGVVNGGTGYLLPFAFIYTMPRTVGLTLSKAF